MHKIIEIKDSFYVFFPYSLSIYPYNSTVEAIIQNEIDSNDKDLKDIKLKIGEITRQEEKNKLLVKECEKKVRGSFKITGLQINIAYGCNMRCKYCFAGDGAHNKMGYLTKGITDDILNFIVQYCSDELFVQIVGGEPLININGFKYLVKELKEKLRERVHFSTTINGMLVNLDVLNFFKKYQIDYMVSLDSHIKYVNDSLRVSNNGKSAYEKIMSDFTKYKEEYNYNSFHITITPNNLNFAKTIEILFSMGAKHISIDFVKSVDAEFKFNDKDIETIKNECKKVEEIILDRIKNNLYVSVHPILTRIGRLHYRKPLLKRCGVCNNLFAIAPDGVIYPCDMLMWNDYKLGSVTKGIDYSKWNKMLDKMESGCCENCWARLLCGGMCFADSIQYGEEKEMLCKLRRVLLESRLRLYIKIKKEFLDFDFDKYL